MKSIFFRGYGPFLLLLALSITACRKEKPTAPPSGGQPVEQELITTLILHFHSMDSSEHKMFTFRDLDGEGGQPPTIDVEQLTAGTVYHVHVEVLDESQTPVMDITQEIEEEGDHHQFFYHVSGVGITIAYDDEDEYGLPIGLRTLWMVGDAGSGTVVVSLRHDPDKLAPGVGDGDITNAGGDTDIEVDFPVTVQ